MLVLLSCAKTMSVSTKLQTPQVSMPRFMDEAQDIALQMTQYSVDELERVLHVNAKIAVENYKRYQTFLSADSPTLPALLAYTGIVFKKLNPKDFSVADFEYAQNHLLLTSFCYGLLRPLDVIHPYRLEGQVKLPEYGGETLFAYWRSRLTNVFIEDIKAAGGVLCNLASDEMRSLFDWKLVEQSVRIVTPEFSIMKGDKRKTIVVYTKMMRGEMTRYILKNRLTDVEQLKSFESEGFQFDPTVSTPDNPVFTFIS